MRREEDLCPDRLLHLGGVAMGEELVGREALVDDRVMERRRRGPARARRPARRVHDHPGRLDHAIFDQAAPERSWLRSHSTQERPRAGRPRARPGTAPVARRRSGPRAPGPGVRSRTRADKARGHARRKSAPRSTTRGALGRQPGRAPGSGRRAGRRKRRRDRRNQPGRERRTRGPRTPGQGSGRASRPACPRSCRLGRPRPRSRGGPPSRRSSSAPRYPDAPAIPVFIGMTIQTADYYATAGASPGRPDMRPSRPPQAVTSRRANTTMAIATAPGEVGRHRDQRRDERRGRGSSLGYRLEQLGGQPAPGARARRR